MDELNDQFKKSAEDFSLIPSSNTWLNVEADIRNRKRKRRFIILFFLFAGIFAGGLFLLKTDSTNTKTENVPQNNIQPQNQPPASQQNILPDKNNESNKRITTSQTNPDIINYVNKKYSSTLKKSVVGKKENHNSKEIPSKINLAGVDSIPTVKNEITHIPPMLSDENEMESTHLEASESCETTTHPTPLSGYGNTIDSAFTTMVNDSLHTKAKADSLSSLKDSLKETTHQSKWSIAIGAAPAIGYSKFHEEGEYQFISNYRDSSDKSLLTWNYHFMVDYKFLQELGIYTGIGIICFDEEILSSQVVYHYDTLNSLVSGPLPPPVTISKSHYNINGDSTGSVKNKFTYLEIPVGISYDFLRGNKFNIALLPEISFNRLIHVEGYLYNYSSSRYEKMADKDLESWLVSYGVGLSFQYKIMKNLNFEFTPYYKSFQESIYKTSYSGSQRFQQAEFRFSFRYLIK